MSDIRTRSIFETDLYIALAAVALLVIGILFVYSSGINSLGELTNTEYIRQIVWAVTGLGLMFAITFTDYRIFERSAVLIFLSMIALLVLTLLFGRVVNGARRWIGIGPLAAQPSEFMKIALIIFLSRYYNRRREKAQQLRVFIGGLLITLLPVGLVLMQPDLGSAIVYMPIFLVIAYFAGAKPTHIGFLVLSGSLFLLLTVLPFWQRHLTHRALPIVGVLTDIRSLQFLMIGFGIAAGISATGWFITTKPIFRMVLYFLTIVLLVLPAAYYARQILRDYQIMRLVVFIDPYIDPRGAGWNIIQSTTAVGSGGIAGKGFLQGTQSHFQFLPAQSTDFIFSILAEEWGFIGVIVVFALVMVIVWRSLFVMLSAREPFAAYLASGVIALYGTHFIINVGMTIGMMPVTGLPLLLLSFGGSSVWTALIALGLVMSVYQHRYQY
jgi:rod shape determining protein RodA